MDLFGKVMSLLFNMLSRLVITFLPKNKRLLISWLQSQPAVVLEPRNDIIQDAPILIFSAIDKIFSEKWLTTPAFLPGEFHDRSLGLKRVRHD